MMSFNAPWNTRQVEMKSHFGMVPHVGVDLRVGQKYDPWLDGALLGLRLGAGALLAGHGAQKLFGWFGGHGLKGTGQWLESMGLKPGTPWALAAAGGEMGGGLMTLLGLASPLGSIGVASAMTMAAAKAHWGKPIWVTEGGAELPLVYSTVAAALAAAGPGRFSMDHVLGIKVPWWVTASVAAMAAGAVAFGATRQPAAQPAAEEAVQEAPMGGDQDMTERTEMTEPVQLGEHRRQEQRAQEQRAA